MPTRRYYLVDTDAREVLAIGHALWLPVMSIGDVIRSGDIREIDRGLPPAPVGLNQGSPDDALTAGRSTREAVALWLDDREGVEIYVTARGGHYPEGPCPFLSDDRGDLRAGWAHWSIPRAAPGWHEWAVPRYEEAHEGAPCMFCGSMDDAKDGMLTSKCEPRVLDWRRRMRERTDRLRPHSPVTPPPSEAP